MEGNQTRSCTSTFFYGKINHLKYYVHRHMGYMIVNKSMKLKKNHKCELEESE